MPNFNKIKAQLPCFELHTFYDNDLKLRQCKQTQLFHNIEKTLFIILYNHYLLKISELKNQVLKLRFQNLINYSTICRWNGKRATVVASRDFAQLDEMINHYLVVKIFIFIFIFWHLCHDEVFLFSLKIFKNLKNKYEKRIFYLFFFGRKKSLDLQKY